MKIITAITFATALLISGCTKKAEEVSAVGAGSIEVARLFTHDGCTVYRFYDAGRHRYFSKCSFSSEVFWKDGKSSEQSIPTNAGEGYTHAR